MECWKPEDAVDKNSFEKFLKYIDNILDIKISPHVHVYKLEDMKKYAHESTDGLVDHIQQFTCHSHTDAGTDMTVKFKAQCHLICAIPDSYIKLQKSLLKDERGEHVAHMLGDSSNLLSCQIWCSCHVFN